MGFILGEFCIMDSPRCQFFKSKIIIKFQESSKLWGFNQAMVSAGLKVHVFTQGINWVIKWEN